MREDLRLSDDVLFDRLVDGELSAAERRELLESLDERPAGWRRCALAFLEAQSWGDELSRLVRQPQATVAYVSATKSLASADSKSSSLGTGMRWLALAASLALAFTLGVKQREKDVPLAVDAPTTDGQIVTIAPPPAANMREGGPDNDALTLWVRDDAGQTRPLRVPLVDAGILDEQLGLQFQSGVPPTVRDHLHGRGYQVQSKRRYAPLWLENGRPMIVPVEDTKIVPVSENVY